MTDNSSRENTDAIQHAGEIPADLRPHIEAPEDTALAEAEARIAARTGEPYNNGGLLGLVTRTYGELPQRVRHSPADPTPHFRQRVAIGSEAEPLRMFDMFRQVFESQAYFQGLLGHSYNDMTTEELIEYLKGQVMALQAETIEALDEMSWKPWTHGDKKINNAAMLGECADILCFLVNIVLGIGYTAEDFYAAHQEKARRNIKRQEQKYDGVQGKCPGCRRDISDLRAKNLPVGNFGGVDYCSPECIEKVNGPRPSLPDSRPAPSYTTSATDTTPSQES